MKSLLLVFLVGFTAAFSHDDLSRASDEVVDSFVSGMSKVPSLHEALGIESSEQVLRFESDIKEELARYLRETFDAVLAKIKDAVAKGKEIHKDVLENLHLLKEKMKDLSITDDDIGDNLLHQLKDAVKGKLKELLEKMGIFDDVKRSVKLEAEENILGDLNIRNLIIRLREMILDKMDADVLKNSIGRFVERGAQRLCSWLSTRGKEKILGFFERVLDGDFEEDKKKRSISDLYQQLKDYFEDMDLDLKQKFFKFGEWVKEVLSKGLDQSRDKIDNVKSIARKLIEKSKGLSKEVAIQAREYMKDYKEELGDLYEKVMEKLMKKIMEYTD